MQNYIILLFVPVYMVCHTPKNSSDVIVTYEGHADSQYSPIQQLKAPHEPVIDFPTESAINIVTERDEVIFVPNERQGQGEGYKGNDEKTVDKIMEGRKSLDEVLRGDVKFETESPHYKDSDTLFVTGKNNERVEERKPSKKKHTESRRAEKINNHDKHATLDCSKLDCNRTSAPVCGGKIEHNRWRYRLFLNECFFRKVNCGFTYEYNRYTEVERRRCHNATASYIVRTHYMPDTVLRDKTKEIMRNNTRRTFSGRRSSNIGLDGHFCSHSCPIVCPEDYNPECAVSNNGEKRVFINHCSLDYNSCFFNVAWHRRPLSECTGNKTAELRQNRGFISWMQRVGIIDKKGRLNIA